MVRLASTHIFSSLESKGLEFDDCLIAFDADRKAWDVGSGGASSLTLVRELCYVAITRAKQRVVILVKSAEMRKFFQSLQSEAASFKNLMQRLRGFVDLQA